MTSEQAPFRHDVSDAVVLMCEACFWETGGGMQMDLGQFQRILVISPHLDDAVLSVGGLMERAAAQGADVVVGTAFTADTPPGAGVSPLAEELHGLWQLGENPFAHRRGEDLASVSSLGARALHGQLMDALYRADEASGSLYPTRLSVFSPPAERDTIGESLFALFDGWVRDISPDLVLSPLCVGRHVDHVQTSMAVRRLAEARGLTVALYEDMPYSTGLFPRHAPDNVDAALQRTPWTVEGPQVVAVELAGKLRAIEAYASQISDIFPNGLDVETVLDGYMRSVGPDGALGERIWQVRA